MVEADVRLQVNGRQLSLVVDTRTTLLDALRERLGISSAKLGCNHGQCGACTVLVHGRRVLSCLMLAVAHDGAEVTTAEGLADGDELHLLQAAFLELDAFQCGYCTPGQLCSAVAMLEEAEAGQPSSVTSSPVTSSTTPIAGSSETSGADGPIVLSDDEIRERMSGNLCRCGAYINIVAAIEKVAGARAAR